MEFAPHCGGDEIKFLPLQLKELATLAFDRQTKVHMFLKVLTYTFSLICDRAYFNSLGNLGYLA
jgi:hypothetical protein